MVLINLLVGIVLLIAGRKLFWLFVGLVGFIWGIHAATHFFPGRPEWMVLAIALTAGVLGALIALFLQWLAIGVAGFSAGAYIVASLLRVWGHGTGGLGWFFILIGGIVGLVLIIALFGWTVIILSSLAGAALITETVHMDHGFTVLLFIVLVVAGMIVQSRVSGHRV